jgi:flagellar protein FlaG
MNSSQQPQPKIILTQSPDYRENYANSVQVRVSVWDFFLAFGLIHQDSAESVTVQNQQGIYLSPQQAKALWNVLGQNLAQYEQAFGAISLEPQHPLPAPQGPVH